MAFYFTSIHKQILAALIRFTSKLVSARGILKVPVFVLMLPAGLLLTIIGMLVLISLVIVLTPFYIIRYVLWSLSAKGRIQHLKEKYQRRQHKLIAREQRRRIKFSQRADKADLQYLVKLTNSEINKRKKYIDHIIFIETKRRLNRCLDEMNFDKALHIYSTIVDTELNLLNDSLNQLFQ